MNRADFRRRLKPWMLPIAMVLGLIFHSVIDRLQWMVTPLIFTMLLITFCRIDPRQFRLSRLTFYIVGIQLGLGAGLYFAIAPWSVELAQGAMICALCPTATAAPVITAMLGGSIATLVAISLLSNTSVALLVPPFFASIGAGSGQPFMAEFMSIAGRLMPMILGALLIALLMMRYAPRVHRGLAGRQALSFYLWATLLVIVVGQTVSFALREPPARIPEMVALALIAGAICVTQFVVGRRLGLRFGDPVAGAQGLMQKNTGLAIWLALAYLDPISSIAPAAYIAWQNTINSVQIYLHERRGDTISGRMRTNPAAKR
ncbi:MAG: transporter [Bacteroides sp.]|nr:transporter [Bacteroides sp.]MCM1095110.1 hypothetical protein [Terasakiella sp.]